MLKWIIIKVKSKQSRKYVGKLSAGCPTIPLWTRMPRHVHVTKLYNDHNSKSLCCQRFNFKIMILFILIQLLVDTECSSGRLCPCSGVSNCGTYELRLSSQNYFSMPESLVQPDAMHYVNICACRNAICVLFHLCALFSYLLIPIVLIWNNAIQTYNLDYMKVRLV